jgi:hypothetical protein
LPARANIRAFRTHGRNNLRFSDPIIVIFARIPARTLFMFDNRIPATWIWIATTRIWITVTAVIIVITRITQTQSIINALPHATYNIAHTTTNSAYNIAQSSTNSAYNIAQSSTNSAYSVSYASCYTSNDIPDSLS